MRTLHRLLIRTLRQFFLAVTKYHCARVARQSWSLRRTWTSSLTWSSRRAQPKHQSRWRRWWRVRRSWCAATLRPCHTCHGKESRREPAARRSSTSRSSDRSRHIPSAQLTTLSSAASGAPSNRSASTRRPSIWSLCGEGPGCPSMWAISAESTKCALWTTSPILASHSHTPASSS